MDIISRGEAQKLGLKTYFPGTPCKAGHIAERGVQNGQCRECTRLTMVIYRAKFPDKARESGNRSHRKRYRLLTEEDKEKRRKKERLRYHENPEPRIEATRKWRMTENGKERHRVHSTAWAKKNPEKAKEIARKNYERNREERDRYAREWYKSHPDAVVSQSARRRAERLNATPIWLTKQHLDEIRGFYRMAQKMKAETGTVYHVDHIVPLRSSIVCGLHVPWNLQILTESENSKKCNKFLQGR